MADLAKIVEELSTLTVLEAAELSKMLEEKWGVSAAAPVAVAAVAGGAAPAAAAEEKTEFTVVLADAGANKINHPSSPCRSPGFHWHVHGRCCYDSHPYACIHADDPVAWNRSCSLRPYLLYCSHFG